MSIPALITAAETLKLSMNTTPKALVNEINTFEMTLSGEDEHTEGVFPIMHAPTAEDEGFASKSEHEQLSANYTYRSDSVHSTSAMVPGISVVAPAPVLSPTTSEPGCGKETAIGPVGAKVEGRGDVEPEAARAPRANRPTFIRLPSRTKVFDHLGPFSSPMSPQSPYLPTSPLSPNPATPRPGMAPRMGSTNSVKTAVGGVKELFKRSESTANVASGTGAPGSPSVILRTMSSFFGSGRRTPGTPGTPELRAELDKKVDYFSLESVNQALEDYKTGVRTDDDSGKVEKLTHFAANLEKARADTKAWITEAMLARDQKDYHKCHVLCKRVLGTQGVEAFHKVLAYNILSHEANNHHHALMYIKNSEKIIKENIGRDPRMQHLKEECQKLRLSVFDRYNLAKDVDNWRPGTPRLDAEKYGRPFKLGLEPGDGKMTDGTCTTDRVLQWMDERVALRGSK
ncbi:hypothetical protein LTR53_013056 [Teratosphaeriaceae sp. CCFEE 6253]|nr:hypothetical protein LTR53_013056 [Teratosphaeriaceae sp. CCFEE 6253]